MLVVLWLMMVVSVRIGVRNLCEVKLRSFLMVVLIRFVCLVMFMFRRVIRMIFSGVNLVKVLIRFCINCSSEEFESWLMMCKGLLVIGCVFVNWIGVRRVDVI